MMAERPTPETVIRWIDRRIWSANTWLDDHGRSSKRPRPETDIEHKEEDVAMFEYMRGCFGAALEKKGEVA